MKINNIGGFSSIDSYVKHRISVYEKQEKNFDTLFEQMFAESDNVMAELSDGYRIRKITYSAFKKNIIAKAPSLAAILENAPSLFLVLSFLRLTVE